MLGGGQVHSDLPLEAKGPLVTKAEEGRQPTTIQDTKLLVHSDPAESCMVPSTQTGGKIKFTAWMLAGKDGNKLEDCPSSTGVGLLRRTWPGS